MFQLKQMVFRNILTCFIVLQTECSRTRFRRFVIKEVQSELLKCCHQKQSERCPALKRDSERKVRECGNETHDWSGCSPGAVRVCHLLNLLFTHNSLCHDDGLCFALFWGSLSF